MGVVVRCPFGSDGLLLESKPVFRRVHLSTPGELSRKGMRLNCYRMPSFSNTHYERSVIGIRLKELMHTCSARSACKWPVCDEFTRVRIVLFIASDKFPASLW